MYKIKNIRLTRIRGFSKLNVSVNLKDKFGKHIIFIGKNGTCKTTLLRALTIALCDKSDGNSLLAEDFGQLLAEGSEDGEIILELESPFSSGVIISSTTIIRSRGK